MLHIVNVARAKSDWRWVGDTRSLAEHKWQFISTEPKNAIERHFPAGDMGRLRAGLKARMARPDIVFSHGPWESLYMAFALTGAPQVRHVAMSFNFTDLPSGKLLAAMRRFFPSIERFVVFSNMERELYSNLFDIPIDRFDFVRWGVKPPIVSPLPSRYDFSYFAALGGEARDYKTFIDAAKLRPNDKFVLIARPYSVDGLTLPPNVTLRLNVPFDEAWSTIWHATASIIPLRNANTPNGHVTLVGSMLMGKPIIITDSVGVRDYVSDKETALLVPARSPEILSTAIAKLSSNPDLRASLGNNARSFAESYCSENTIVKYVENVLR